MVVVIVCIFSALNVLVAAVNLKMAKRTWNIARRVVESDPPTHNLAESE